MDRDEEVEVTDISPHFGDSDLTSRWLNCAGDWAVISGSNPGAVLLSDNVYMNGSRTNSNHNIWKYSVAENSMSPLSYPPCYALDTLTDYQALTVYQSQLLCIGRCDKYSAKIKVFVLCDESMHSWKEIMHDIPQVAPDVIESPAPIITFISATGKGKYLIIVVSLRYRGMVVLLFDGQEWKTRDIPSGPPETAYGETDVLIHNGILYLCTYVGFYKVYLETSLATNLIQLSWKKLCCVPEKRHSNLTLFNDHIVVITTAQAIKAQESDYQYDVDIIMLAYQSTDDYWLVLKKFECYLHWSKPSIMGLPSGRLLILGVTPESDSPQFNILEVIAKGDDVDEEKHIRATLKAMEKQGELHHSTVHGVFIGPARSGKNSLMERLLGKMPSSNSPSTGVAEAVVQVQIQKSCIMVANVEGSVWSRIDYDDEAIRLMVLHSDHDKVQFEAPHVHNVPIAANLIPFSIIVSHEGTESSVQIAPLSKYCEVPNEPTIATPMLYTRSTEHLPASYIPPLEILKTAIKLKGIQALQQHFEKTWSLYLSNTGGQMEFQEVLPLLVSGPCMFFYTFRLDRDLNECYEIHYELLDGTTSDTYKSSVSTIEGIVQSLASIAAMGIFVYRGSQKRKVRLRPKVLFIGTHRDRLDQERATDIIASIDQNLQKSTSQFSNLIEFASKDQMLFAVNNFSEDDTVFQDIRSSVECIVERHEFEMVSPSRWLIYSLALRRLKAEIVTYEECFEIAKQCGIADKEELTEALHFIHTKMGLIRYFPFERIKDLVIIQPQFLYDKISELIIKTFTFEKAGKKSADLFNEKGIFSLDDFERIHRKSDSTSAMEPTQFTELLKALHIAAPFEEGSNGDGESRLFFPCILGHASKAQEQIEISSLEISPLNVTFKCGYCPKGLGGALINFLMTNGTNFNLEWNLLTDQIFRDQVSFEVGPLDTVILRILPTHLMLIYVPEVDFPDRSTCCIEDVCCDIREAVDTGIRKVVQALNFIPSEVEPSFTFLCPCDKCGNKYPAEMKLRHDKPFCLGCTKSRSRHQLPKGYDKWFTTNPRVQSTETKAVIDHDRRTRLSELHHPALLEKLTKYAAHWRNIGERLRFTPDELNDIEARPLLLHGAPRSWLREMLAEWLQWAPGDSRGSRDFATLEALKSALDEAGLAAAASDLQL